MGVPAECGPRPRWVLALAAFVLVVGLLALAVEAAGLVLAFLGTKQILYFREAPAVTSSSAMTNADARFEYRQLFHPYWGFSGQSGAALLDGRVTNRFGFIQQKPLPLPQKRREREFIVAVFGGSVAHNLVHGSAGGQTLEAALADRAELKGRAIAVINMAQGAGKQPQQLLELAYLLSLGQEIDLVLNVDGYNDFALSYLNTKVGLHPAMPSSLLILPLATGMQASDRNDISYYEYVYHLMRARLRYKTATAALDSSRSGAGYLYAFVARKLSEREVSSLTSNYNAMIASLKGSAALSLEMLEPNEMPDEQVFENIFQQWLSSSKLMRAMSLATGARYLHVIQPNQYFSERVFGEAERKVAVPLAPDDPNVHAISVGYKRIKQSGDLLRSWGVISALEILDAEKEPMYRDSCCHYTAAGETLLAKFIATQVAKAMAH